MVATAEMGDRLAPMLQRFLQPSVLAAISSLDLVAKTVVDGFVSGLHQSPDFATEGPLVR